MVSSGRPISGIRRIPAQKSISTRQNQPPRMSSGSMPGTSEGTGAW